MVGLVVVVVGASLAGFSPDIGVLCFAFGAVLSLVDPASGRIAVSRIDWSTVLLVGGIITFVGVLQNMGAVDMLGDAAARLGVPILTALVICFIGALVSAFASTTGILAALVPLALPLVASGEVAGWALSERARRLFLDRRRLAVLDRRAPRWSPPPPKRIVHA